MQRNFNRPSPALPAIRAGLLAAAAVAIATAAWASARHQAFGTIYAPVRQATPHNGVFAPGAGAPFRQYSNASYGTGGAAMRNRSDASVNISGVIGASQDAWVYWAVLVGGTPTKHQKIKVIRRFPLGTPSSVVVIGDLIATPGDPCWGSSRAAVYRAQVPTNIATGNGLYQIEMNATETTVTDGSDPWAGGVAFPAAEGASLVVVGKGSSSVYLYDFFPTEIQGGAVLSYTLSVPGGMGTVATLDSFGADGQIGTSRQADPADSGEVAFVDGAQISGPGSPFDTDSDWNGNSGFPLPQLWDDIGHDISGIAQAGSTSLNVAVTSGVDCIIPIGNVLATH
jgi:hypothetical protein